MSSLAPNLEPDDESDGLHEGPCEYEDGYGDWPYTETRCVKCCAAIRESKRTACPDCCGSGLVIVAAVATLRKRRDDVRVAGAAEQRCMACLGSGRKMA